MAKKAKKAKPAKKAAPRGTKVTYRMLKQAAAGKKITGGSK